jgi:hypothetical protein
MPSHEATFHIDSRADAEAVRLVAERVYDALREETKDGSNDTPNQMLDTFRALRDATRRPRPGTLTIRYDPRDESFESR